MESMRPNAHPDREALARLVDGEPTSGEREHLESCVRCREELEALRRQTEALSNLPDLMPPMGDWEELEARLTGEGLVRARSVAGLPFRVQAGWGQIAAALVVFAAGSLLGAGVARGTPDPVPGEPLAGGVVVPVARAADAEEAAEVLQAAEQSYMAALMQYRRLAGFDGDTGGSSDPVSRFAALDALVSASQAALRQAPTDPFLNGVLVSTMAERQATLSQISSTDEGSWY